jgi:glycosyltransferase involved in cell wall biosynthesis
VQHPAQIVCVCCGQGFPNGMAQTSRIRLVGQALVAGGCQFTVLNIGGGLCPNPASKGRVDGIQFEHLPGQTRRYGNPITRKLAHAIGALQAGARLSGLCRREPNVCVYSWFEGGRRAWFHRYLRSIPCNIVQEVNEWWPGVQERKIRDLNVRLTQGSLAISRPILERLTNLPSYTTAHKILRIPILVEPEQWMAPEHSICPPEFLQPYVLWCGNLGCATTDIEFLIRVVRTVNERVKCQLVLVGQYSGATHKQLCNLSASIGLRADCLRLPGYSPHDELRSLMNRASALLLPLWETERSLCRFPTKLGEYLSSTTPVVATSLGDLMGYLKDGDSACLVAPNAVAEFAERILFLLRNKEQAKAIGIAGREVARRHFSVEANRQQLTDFFVGIANGDDRRRK